VTKLFLGLSMNINYKPNQQETTQPLKVKYKEKSMLSVLYVDDEEMLLDIGKLFLERSGDCSVDIAISARKGIEQMGNKTYDAIVSDYQMPGMDGIEFLKNIRATSTIPFILFTGKGREEVVIEAINSGADFYLQKGGDPKSQFVELKHKILQAVNRRRTEDELRKSETRYRQLVDLLPQTVFEIDQTLTITSINPVALKSFGYTQEDLKKGVTVFEVFSEDDHERIRENIGKILHGEPSGALEYMAKRKDGSTFPVITYSVPIMQENIPVGLRGVLVDITERKAAELATLQALSLLEATLESTADGLLVIDRSGKIVNYNQKFAEMWKIPQSVLDTGDDATAIRHVLSQLTDPDVFLSKVQALYKNPSEFSSDVLVFKDGRIFERYSQPQKLGDTVVGRVWSFRDVTDRKRAESALKESEIRYRTIFEHTGTAMVIIEEDTTVGFANKEFFSLTGYSQDDIDSRKSWTEFVHKEDLPRMIEQHKLRRAGSSEALSHYEFRLLTKSGDIRQILLTIEMFPGTKRSIASLIDITGRKCAEENLQTSRLLMQSVFDAVPDLLIVIDRNYTILYTNAKGHDLIHQEDPERRKTCYGRFKLLDEPCEICSARPVFETGKMSEQEMINPADGRIREVRAFPIKDPQGHVSYVIEYVRDITDRKRIEEALRESEEKYRIVAEGASDGIAIIRDGRFEYVNPRLAHMAGYTVEELTGASFIRFISPESVGDLLEVVRKAFSGEPAPTIFQTRIRHHDGHLIEIEASGTAITWKGKKALLGFIRNMSGRIKAEEGGGKKGKKPG
jgi:PAS domain S-box-containing protein